MKIGIIHYRAGKTDGVSLEIGKRKAILEQLGHSVKVISGPENIGSDYEIPELEFELPEIQRIKENAFCYFDKHDTNEKELLNLLWKTSRIIENRFYFIQNKEKFDLILAHNIFSHGRHIAAASSIAAVIQNLEIPCLATNHDYYWEREEYQEPAYPFISEYLDEYIPFKSDLIRYVSINSIAAEECEKRNGIDTEILPDIFDFNQPEWIEDDFNRSFKSDLNINDNDLIILQATRIVPRKAIESAVAFTEKLTKFREELYGRQLYNGKEITRDSRIILLLAGYAEPSSSDYLEKIEKITESKCIDAIFASDSINAERGVNGKKIYSLWDAYVSADIVTFPSLSEGWGNQFIEAVFAKKPIVAFEYPVFKKDIAEEGYSYISLGDKVESFDKNGLAILPERAIDKAVTQTIEEINSPMTSSLLSKNFDIGIKFHGYKVMEKFISEYINSL